MPRTHMTTVAVFLMLTLTLCACAPSTPPFFDYEDHYYGDYLAYRQAQWDRYNSEREWRLKRERIALQDNRPQLEHARLEWEKKTTERLNNEQELRTQWERDKARLDQQLHEQELFTQQQYEQVLDEQQRHGQRGRQSEHPYEHLFNSQQRRNQPPHTGKL